MSRNTNTVDDERQIKCAEKAYLLQGTFTEVMHDFFFSRSSTTFIVIKYFTFYMYNCTTVFIRILVWAAVQIHHRLGGFCNIYFSTIWRVQDQDDSTSSVS